MGDVRHASQGPPRTMTPSDQGGPDSVWADVLTHRGGTCQDQAVPGSGGPPLTGGKLVQEEAPGLSVALEFDVSNI